MKKYSLPERFIEKSFYLSVWLIRQLFESENLRQKVEDLEQMEEGTLGREIARCLREYHLGLVPNYENHDLKHILLDFRMTPLDEIRMQAFMLGNSNWSVPSLGIFIFGAILLPHKWSQFRKDFLEGMRALPVKDWTIEVYATRQVDELRALVFSSKKEISPAIADAFILQKISRYGSFAAIAAGAFGMFFCLPFLWSSHLEDLVGAGFPFVAGAILIVGGLMNLSILSRRLELSAKTN